MIFSTRFFASPLEPATHQGRCSARPTGLRIHQIFVVSEYARLVIQCSSSPLEDEQSRSRRRVKPAVQIRKFRLCKCRPRSERQRRATASKAERRAQVDTASRVPPVSAARPFSFNNIAILALIPLILPGCFEPLLSRRSQAAILWPRGFPEPSGSV